MKIGKQYCCFSLFFSFDCIFLLSTMSFRFPASGLFPAVFRHQRLRNANRRKRSGERSIRLMKCRQRVAPAVSKANSAKGRQMDLRSIMIVPAVCPNVGSGVVLGWFKVFTTANLRIFLRFPNTENLYNRLRKLILFYASMQCGCGGDVLRDIRSNFAVFPQECIGSYKICTLLDYMYHQEMLFL